MTKQSDSVKKSPLAKLPFYLNRASQVVLVVKNLPAKGGDAKHRGSTPGSGRFPWRRAWQPTPVLLPKESHGQRSLAGYGPPGHKELDRHN